MPSVFPYVAQVVTKSYCPNLLYFHLGLCGQYHMCVHLQCIIQSQVHSYPFSSDFHFLFLMVGFAWDDMSFTSRAFALKSIVLRVSFRQIGLTCWASAQSTYWSIQLEL